MTEKKVDYKVLNAELDEIIVKLQSADLDVDNAVGLYERGMEITKELETYLKEAENKVSRVRANWEARSKA